MFYVAPLFLIALLAWIERGLPRGTRLGDGRDHPRGARSRARSRTRALIGLQRRSRTRSRCSRSVAASTRGSASTTSALVVVFSLRRRGAAVPARSRAGTRSRCRCSCSCTSPSRSGRSRRRTTASRRRSLFGGITDPHRDWIDRAVGSRRGRRRGLDGRHGAQVHDLAERVLQPQRRDDLPTGAPVAGRPGRDAGHASAPRPERCSPPDGSAARSTSSPRRPSRSTATVIAQDRGKGMVLYRVERAAAAGRADHGRVRRRHLVGPRGHVYAVRLQRRHTDGRSSRAIRTCSRGRTRWSRSRRAATRPRSCRRRAPSSSACR